MPVRPFNCLREILKIQQPIIKTKMRAAKIICSAMRWSQRDKQNLSLEDPSIRMEFPYPIAAIFAQVLVFDSSLAIFCHEFLI